jgi:hypothetical protein
MLTWNKIYVEFEKIYIRKFAKNDFNFYYNYCCLAAKFIKTFAVGWIQHINFLNLVYSLFNDITPIYQ